MDGRSRPTASIESGIWAGSSIVWVWSINLNPNSSPNFSILCNYSHFKSLIHHNSPTSSHSSLPHTLDLLYSPLIFFSFTSVSSTSDQSSLCHNTTLSSHPSYLLLLLLFLVLYLHTRDRSTTLHLPPVSVSPLSYTFPSFSSSTTNNHHHLTSLP